MRTIARLLLVVFFGLLSAPITASAQSDDTAQMARAVVEKQLDAFAHEDEQAAYALAAPGIRDRFPDAGQFMEMVRMQYPVVVRHRSVDFGPSAAEGDKARQSVTFVDDDNVVWTALYSFRRVSNGDWLISGCVLAKAEGSAI
jgi:hypothetical protein